MIDRASIEKLVGTKVKNTKFYERAFTHKSSYKNNPTYDGSYETLEFMGDSVLGFVITKYLFDRYEKHQEGFLTRARTKLVRGKMLASIAKKMSLGNWIVMDEKGMRNRWNTNPKILEDVFEALVGAIYLDLGMVHARNFVLGVFERYVDMNCIMEDDNYKEMLMKYYQSNNFILPEYHLDKQENNIFYVSVRSYGSVNGWGAGKTKKQAEQNAAFNTLKGFGVL